MLYVPDMERKGGLVIPTSPGAFDVGYQANTEIIICFELQLLFPRVVVFLCVCGGWQILLLRVSLIVYSFFALSGARHIITIVVQ